jgi:hypothetical protein
LRIVISVSGTGGGLTSPATFVVTTPQVAACPSMRCRTRWAYPTVAAAKGRPSLPPQYGEWLHFNRDRPILENGVGRTNDRGEIYSVKHLIQSLSPNALSTWWVYFGRIPPSMIEGLPEGIKKKKKPWAIEEDTTLEIALNKFIRSETTRLAP